MSVPVAFLSIFLLMPRLFSIFLSLGSVTILCFGTVTAGFKLLASLVKGRFGTIEDLEEAAARREEVL